MLVFISRCSIKWTDSARLARSLESSFSIFSIWVSEEDFWVDVIWNLGGLVGFGFWGDGFFFEKDFFFL